MAHKPGHKYDPDNPLGVDPKNPLNVDPKDPLGLKKKQYDPTVFSQEIKKPVELGGKSSLLSGSSLDLSQGKSPFSFDIKMERSQTTSPDFSLSSAGGDIPLSPKEGEGTEEAMEYVDKGEKGEKEYYSRLRKGIEQATDPLREAKLKARLGRKLSRKEHGAKKREGYDIDINDKTYHVPGKDEMKGLHKQVSREERLKHRALRKGYPVGEGEEIKDMPIEDIEAGKAEAPSLDTSGDAGGDFLSGIKKTQEKIQEGIQKIGEYKFGQQPQKTKTLSGISEGISLTQPIKQAAKEKEISGVAQDLDPEQTKKLKELEFTGNVDPTLTEYQHPSGLKKEKEIDLPELGGRKPDVSSELPVQKESTTSLLTGDDPISREQEYVSSVEKGKDPTKWEDISETVSKSKKITKEKAGDIVAEKLGLGPKKTITPKEEVVKKEIKPVMSSDPTTGKITLDPTILQQHKSKTSESKVYPTRTRTSAEAKIQAKEHGLKGKSKREYVKTAVEKWKTKDDKPVTEHSDKDIATALEISRKLKGVNP